jgi:uncharacterized protein
MKYLILFAVLGFVWWKWRQRDQPLEGRPKNKASAPQKMLVCAQCGVHFPESDGLSEGGQIYCSEAGCCAARKAGRR